MCKKLPSIQNQCQEFIDTYGDAILAILVQQIDPAQVSVFFIYERKVSEACLNCLIIQGVPNDTYLPVEGIIRNVAANSQGIHSRRGAR